MDMKQIREQVMAMDSKQLNRLVSAIKSRRRVLKLQATRHFDVGDEVWFEDRHGRRQEGQVVKVNRVTCKVRVDRVVWTVTSTLLHEMES